MIAAQSHLFQNIDLPTPTKSDVNPWSKAVDSAMTSNNSDDLLSPIPDDALFQILLHCGPREVDESVKFVCRRLHKASSTSLDLWRAFCSMTGKSLDKCDSNNPKKNINRFFLSQASYNQAIETSQSNFYRNYYFRNPCVPIDFNSINIALQHCPRTKADPYPIEDETSFYSDEGSVVLMPGTYQERVVINGDTYVEGQPLQSVTLRAAFPEIGAALVHYQRIHGDEETKNQSAISVTTRSESDNLEEKGIFVKLSYLQILHSTPGADIWGGNTAILIDGLGVQVVIDSCKIQSDSGRGLVVTNQAEIHMTHSIIVNCAATGFYLGDWGSRAKITSSNIVGCGFGDIALQEPSSEEERVERDALWDLLVVRATTGQSTPMNRIEVVPPGHSGVYVESSIAWIEDTLIAGNSLTGVSVVRSGFVNLSGSDITENGGRNEEQIMIEDLHDVRENVRLNGINIRGGLVEGPLANNFTSRKSGNEGILYRGGMVRKVQYSISEPLSLVDLLR